MARSCGRCTHPSDHHVPDKSSGAVGLKPNDPGDPDAALAVKCTDCPERRVRTDSVGGIGLTRVCPMGSLRELLDRFGELNRGRPVQEAIPAPA